MAVNFPSLSRRDSIRLGLGAGAWIGTTSPAQVSNAPQRVTLSSETASASFDLLGGGLADFRLRGHDLNPLSWERPGEASQPRAKGHFLCLDRWGPASEAEQKNGMPFHGEASTSVWKQTGAGRMEAFLPLAQLQVERTATLQGSDLIVQERVTNRGKLGRIYNMVQHPTIAPPFLDEETFVDTVVGPGLPQNEPALRLTWNASFRRLTTDPNPNVVSFVIYQPHGWVTAVSPAHQLLIGYVWDSRDYPWLNLWRHVQNGRPAARGLEFGTTGLHQPFPELVRRGGKLHEKPLYAYIDAGETQTRSYRAFLRRTPKGAQQVNGVRVSATGEVEVTF